MFCSDTVVVGSQVAFRLPRNKSNDADWIQCIVTRIRGEGAKARYDVQDPEPDENNNPGATYTSTANNLILIPSDSAGLSSIPPGTFVLARYPETTTFYRAEVTGIRVSHAKNQCRIPFKRYREMGTCKLRFEGEEEVGKEQEVERRLVLEY